MILFKIKVNSNTMILFNHNIAIVWKFTDKWICTSNPNSSIKLLNNAVKVNLFTLIKYYFKK